MNGVHDMGGMHGFGPVVREADEPVFHAAWEGRLVGMRRALGVLGLVTSPESRRAIETMDPAHYLAASYYERWLDAFERLLLEKGIVTADEVAARVAVYTGDPDAPLPVVNNPTAAGLPARFTAREALPPEEITPRYVPGDAVRVRVAHPAGHTRRPRYVRGRRGRIHRVQGTFPLDDETAYGRRGRPEPVYSVEFDARELWGDSAEPNQRVHLDLWESYLEPAEE
jgi:nitrile hydratase subunit beta